ncbi:PstS family phosphate ABC transporter substrate-binding protein [Sessilibacter sp. MAH1]
MKKVLLSTLLLATCSGVANTALAARDYIEIVGSSTVYPFSTVVAERFGRATSFKTPKIEATGSGGGLKLFCQGVGVNYPDIANASRKIKDSEFKQCQANGVKDIVEVLIGYDGIVLGNSAEAEPLNITRKQLFLALAKKTPDEANPGKLIDNPYVNWSDIDAKLPESKIEVLGPPPTSGTRDAFVELVMEAGCSSYSWIKDLEKTHKDQFKAICHTVREDGSYIEAGENDNLIVQKLDANKNAFGIFGFSFLDQNADIIHGAFIDGSQPTFDAIAEGTYPVSRPLYFYVKKEHINFIPGIAEYLSEFTSSKAWGEEGYLAEKGMIPLSEEERKSIKARVENLESLAM